MLASGAIDPWKNFKHIEAYEPTGIDEIGSDFYYDDPTEIYDLSGMKVTDSTDDLAPGVYIVRQGNNVKKIYKTTK